MRPMTDITGIVTKTAKTEYSATERIDVTVKFSVRGGARDAFNEENWTASYDANDVAIKIKYGVKLATGGIRKKTLGTPLDSYKKAAIFWTRNPKLVNPMKERRIWIQVAKNFRPIIRLTEEEVRQELFDFEEEYTINASELGAGTHKIGGEVHVQWQKHHFLEQTSLRGHIPETSLTINI